MASTINASTSPAAIVQTADGTANLSLQSNGTTIAALTSTGMAVTGTLSASGAATLSSTLDVTGAATLSSTLGVTGNLSFNSGYGSVATAYGCRAWVNFNGTGTVAIRASGNVSSITDNGTGDYTVNFTTSMTDANYCAVASGNSTSSSITVGQPNSSAFAYSAPTTSACRVFFSSNTIAKDIDVCNVSIFR